MKRAVILNSINDAEHCITNNIHVGKMLFCSHKGVCIYLKYHYNIDSIYLEELFSVNDIQKFNKQVQIIIDQLLPILDQSISSELNFYCDFNLNYFQVLYSYVAKKQLITYCLIFQSIKRIHLRYLIDDLYLYDLQIDNFLNINKNSSFLVEFETLLNVRIKIITHHYKVENQYNFFIRKNLIKKIKIREIPQILNTQDCLDSNLPSFCRSILALDNYLEIVDDLKKEFNTFNFINANELNNLNMDYEIDIKEFIEKIDFKLEIQEISQCLINMLILDLVKDFSINIMKYLSCLFKLKQIHYRTSFCIGIWATPPTEKGPSLLFDYLRKLNIPVLGFQAPSPGISETYNIFAFDSLFNRCDCFLSLGLSKEELNCLYKDKLTIKVRPVGSVNKLRKIENQSIHRCKKEKIRIFFPIELDSSFYQDAAYKMGITDKQIAILNYLDTLNDEQVYVKLSSPFNPQTSTIFPLISQYKSIKFISNLNTCDIIANYDFDVVLLDNPLHEDLYEMLSLNTEIFIINHELMKYDKSSLSYLEKRIHIGNLNEILKFLKDYLTGKIISKRNNQFINKYMLIGNEREKVIDVVKSYIK